MVDPVEHEDFSGEPLGPVGPPSDDGPADGRADSRQPGSAYYSVELGDVIRRHREGTRRWLAFGLVLLLAFLAMLSLSAIVFGWQTTENVRSAVEVLLPPIVALTGSALGFYFGVESAAQER